MNTASPTWTAAYLAHLGLPAEPPSLPALHRLIAAQVFGVTFENVTSLRRAAAALEGPLAPLAPEAALAAWRAGHAGGVCYEAAGMFYRLLVALGYEVQPVLGAIAFPGSHQASVVNLPEGRYLADVGCGAPILQAVPLDAITELRHAGLGFRYRPGDAPDTLVQERHIDGQWAAFCTYDLRPATAEGLALAFRRHHTAGESWVTTTLSLVRCTPDAVHQVRNHDFTTYTSSGKQTILLDDDTAVIDTVLAVFGLPALPVAAALAALARLRLAAKPTTGG